MFYKSLILCLLVATLAVAQRQSVVVLPSVADPEAKLSPRELELLTEKVRSIIPEILPLKDFNLLKQDAVLERLGAEGLFAACKEGSCVGDLVARVQADFGARCEVLSVNKQLYLKFELYGTLRGEKDAGTIDQFNEPVKNFAEMQAVINKKVPGIFKKITKSPQEACEAAGNVWENGICLTAAQMAKEACEAEGKKWIGGACKSSAQIACEATAGRKWSGEECKTAEQIACENKGSMWVNGVCRSQAAVPIPVAGVPVAGGSYVAQIETEPTGASLNLNGAPYQGCLKTPCAISLYENRVKLSAVLSEHETADTTVTITMPNQLVTIKLKPKTYTVHFASEPSGASLTLEDDNKSSYKCETPCSTYLKKGRVKVSAGSDAYYDRKDTAISVTGDNQRVNLRLNPNYGTVDIKGADGWDLTIGDRRTPSLDNIRLLPGAYNAKLTNDDYEDIDFKVDIKKGEHKVFDISDKIVHKFGFLDIEPAYSEGIGKGENWNLAVDGQPSSLSEVRLLHGEHQLRLTHNCYEDITAEAKIGRNEKTNFDISDKLALKQGILVLRAKRKVRNVSKPVFVNGKNVGNTPYEGSVPLCSEIKIGKDEEVVHVKLEHNKPVEYTHKETTTKSHVLGAVFDVAGVTLLGVSYFRFSLRDKAYKDYSNTVPLPGEPSSKYPGLYDTDWNKVESNHSQGNTLLIIGSAVLALGIGVHIWF